MTQETSHKDKEYDKNTKIAWMAYHSGMDDVVKEYLPLIKYSEEELKDMMIPLTRDDLYENFTAKLRFYNRWNRYTNRHLFPMNSGFWDNFKVFRQALSLTGQEIDVEFFRKGVKSNHSLQDFAQSCNRFESTFFHEHWKGKEKELISYYISQDTYYKRSLNIHRLRKQLCTFEGRSYRTEIVNALLGRENTNLLEVIQGGRTDMYEAMLTSNGFKPHPDDIFIPCDMEHGRANFRTPSHFEHFPKWAKLLKKYGHKIDVSDMLRSYGSAQSILGEMTYYDVEKVFDPAIWDGQLDDMLVLWSHLDYTKKREDQHLVFWQNYAAVEDVSYRFPYKIDHRLKKAALAWPLRQEGLPETMTAYGTEKFWSNFEKIQSIMDKQGTPIVIDDLYGEVGEAGETALMKAIKFGCFYDVLTTVNPDKGIYIKADELLKTNCFEKSALDYIIENGHLDELFDVRLWRGNPDGMRDMWQKVPDCIEKKMVRDFGYRMARVNRENLLNSKKRPKSRLRM